MSMDLDTDCPHCEAREGEICSEDCSVNGKLIKVLHNTLSQLGLYRQGFLLRRKIK